MSHRIHGLKYLNYVFDFGMQRYLYACSYVCISPGYFNTCMHVPIYVYLLVTSILVMVKPVQGKYNKWSFILILDNKHLSRNHYFILFIYTMYFCGQRTDFLIFLQYSVSLVFPRKTFSAKNIFNQICA